MAGFIRRRVTKTGKTVGDWMGMTVITGVFGIVKEIFIMVFMPWKRGPAGPAESFEDAAKRLNLTDAVIEQRKKSFFYQTLLYLGLGFTVIIYGVVLAFDQHVMGTVISFIVSCVAFANAFRAHFWYFQTKQRKLGCTFQEWLNGSLGG